MRIVIKVGSSTLSYSTGRMNLRRVEALVKVLSDLKNAGHEIIFVSSGAIAMGVGKLGLHERPGDIPGKQAAAAVGQCELMYTYDKLFSEYSHTVATEEIVIGDNDTLAAVVATSVEADLLILMSDIDGLYTADPRRDDRAEIIETVRELTPEIYELAGGSGSVLGTGGMRTKLHAARIATQAGVDMIIMNGNKPERLYDAVEGRSVGTRFLKKAHGNS